MNKDNIENVIHSIVASVSLKLLDYFKNEDCFKTLRLFSESNTFKNLYDIKTKLWKESSDYVLNEYLKEIGYSKH